MTRALRILHVFPSFGVGGSQMRLVALTKGFGREFSHTIMSLSGDRGAADFLSPDLDIEFAEAPSAAGSLMTRLSRYRKLFAHACAGSAGDL